jgi:hypothetical protein
VATVNADLKVGALEETITVTGETPIVDVQSVRAQQTVSKDVLAAIPSSRSGGGIQALIPGMSSDGDSGGITGGGGSAGQIHGSRGSDSRTYNDGLNVGWAGGGGGQWGNGINVAVAQEVVLSTSGGLGEAETAGVSLNVIPREGGNTYSGTFAANGAKGAWQGSNYTQSLKVAASSATGCGFTRRTGRSRPTTPCPACGSIEMRPTRTPGLLISTGASRRISHSSIES